MKFITKEELRKIVPYIGLKNLNTYIEPLNLAMDEFKIYTKLRISAFIAQLAHESGSFNFVVEIASGSAYDNRKDLGNTEPLAEKMAEKNNTTTGKFYKGRGLIQITGFYNYREAGQALDLDLVDYPQLLEEPFNACRSAAWYWGSRDLNSLADRSEFRKITKIINGGYNGITERFKFYFEALKVLG